MRPRDPAMANTCDWFMFGDETPDYSKREIRAREGLAEIFGEAPAEEQAEKPDWMKTEKKADSGDIFDQ